MAIKIYSPEKDFYVHDKEEFIKNHEVIVASGGLVKNAEDKLLFIFRRGKWDLPKGKLDEGESLEKCAERELKEETGLKEVYVQMPLITTYHIYTDKGKEILKETHWFHMFSPGVQQLHPQTDEDIDQAEWANPSELSKYLANTYPLIYDVLASAGYIK